MVGFLAGDVRFRDSYALRNAPCRNPRIPQRITFSLLKFLSIVDLADISGERQMPVDMRREIEIMIAEKIAPMLMRMKIALAKRASAAALPLLMENRDVRVVRDVSKVTGLQNISISC
jgi:hypothetical protein